MAREQIIAKTRNPNQITAVGKVNEDKSVVLARTVLRPTVHAAVTLKHYSKSYGELDLSGLVGALAEAVTDGDLVQGEAMLTAQAYTLDAIFNNLAQRAINADCMDQLDRYLKLALRAQSQCRATREALAAIKNPPVVGYVGQANIAQGNQQVNNAAPAQDDNSRARKNTDLQNKLLERDNAERLDIGATGTTGQANPAMAPLGEVNRTKDTRR